MKENLDKRRFEESLRRRSTRSSDLISILSSRVLVLLALSNISVLVVDQNSPGLLIGNCLITGEIGNKKRANAFIRMKTPEHKQIKVHDLEPRTESPPGHPGCHPDSGVLSVLSGLLHLWCWSNSRLHLDGFVRQRHESLMAFTESPLPAPGPTQTWIPSLPLSCLTEVQDGVLHQGQRSGL